ncbi:MAG: IS21 family transposase [Spirochaetia bacterium]|nr:IS21 family transposase [Spirochaetia bacterium]
MIDLDQKAEILMKYFRENKSQRKISNELGISRTTVQKYIKDFETKQEKLNILSKTNEDLNKLKIQNLINDLSSKPKYNTSNRKKTKLTINIKNRIEEFIQINDKNKALGRKKQVMKKIDMYEQLVEEGYDIGYTTVCNFIKDKYDKKEAFIRQEYDPAEVLEFDWGEVKVNVAGKAATLNIGLFSTAKESYHYSRVYQNQKMENFLDIHVKAFTNIAGIHKVLVYDNLKQAVRRFVSRTEKEATEDLIKISLYYGFTYRFCNVRKGNEKGHVERGIEFIRRKAFSLKTDFDSVGEVNEHLENILEKLNNKKRNWLNNKSPKEVLEENRKNLIPLKPEYDISRRIESRVNKYSVVTIDQNKYSVPDYLVGKFVNVKIFPDNINIYYKNSKIAEHKRSYQNHQWVIDINHFIHTLKKKPGALHASVGRHQLSPELQNIYKEYYSNNPRDFISLLEIIKEKDVINVLNAINRLVKIKKDLVTTDNIKNIIYKLPEENKVETKGSSEIYQASINQITMLNEMFKLNSLGGINP